ncbi:MAG: hypothetical protein WKF73_05675 [Nocardioidaceae bacterium]
MSNNTRPGLSALTKDDPPRLGPVTLLGRLDATDAGVIYAGSLEGVSVATVLLSQGAELDSYGRARFLQAIDQHVDNGGPRSWHLSSTTVLLRLGWPFPPRPGPPRWVWARRCSRL